jgi:hypothetical protein
LGGLSGRVEGGGNGDTVDTASIDLKLENVMKVIGYAEFSKICRVGDPRNWHGMAVKADGVWVQLPPDNALLFPGERAVLSAHPKKDLTTPALEFPCTYERLRIFLEWVEVGRAAAYLGTEVSGTANDHQKGGRPKGSLYAAVEYAYKKFLDEGNTEILRPGKVIEFLDRLKELSGGENRKISDYIAERIEIVKKRNGSFTIITQERIIKEVKGRVITETENTYTKGDVSKLLTALRKKFPLPA